MDMIADQRESTTIDLAWLGFHELLEAVFQELLVFHVVGFVLFCKGI
jgi:hypothetical protein